jgi:hypothetical protein
MTGFSFTALHFLTRRIIVSQQQLGLELISSSGFIRCPHPNSLVRFRFSFRRSICPLISVQFFVLPVHEMKHLLLTRGIQLQDTCRKFDFITYFYAGLSSVDVVNFYWSNELTTSIDIFRCIKTAPGNLEMSN